MVDTKELESTEPIRIDKALLDSIREWAAASGRTVTGQLREIVRPAVMAYLEGKMAGIREVATDATPGQRVSGP